MTRVHGLVGMFLKLDPITDQGVYTIAKDFSNSVAKGNVEAKHETEETRKQGITL